ncbi:phage major capsid protein [Bradyrhizobium elkanii]|uniref:phage major capsid protein n=1 Tax=Bradyrhizobium elkanii TaxID=29448 RepID=UPI0004B65184|nr:phage major capsid protein [Bradyrhizobium elkanii]WLA79586.1 phage major capsid protein [Bradyrhizobium elkanii]
MNMHIHKGAYLTKEVPPAAADAKEAEAMLANLTKELGSITTLLEANKQATETQYKDLKAHYSGLKADSEAVRAEVQKHAAEYAALVTQQQALQQALDQVKKEMDAPLIRGGSDLKDHDIKAAIELQRRAFLFKGGDNDDFTPDMDNLVDASQYRSAVRKLMKVGVESKQKIVRSLTEMERKAFEASSLDAAMFSPEMLGIEVDCIIECAELLDLYGQVTVGKSTFMYPQVMDYGAIGKYDCDAKCDAEYGPEGNIQYKNGAVSDFRGVFCLQRKVLTEANYPLLDFMYKAAARSYRINRNRALMTGDGINEPLGWLTNDCFTKMKTSGATFNHIDFRIFFASAPVEYGAVTAVMHQNVFAYLACMVDSVGRFLFGDGLMTYSPDDVRERIRISNCLPDATDGLTKGSAANPFTTGDFLVAAGSWGRAYYVVNKRPLWIEQWEGQSSAWCVKYQFGAEDGGFTACCPAARILTVGP